MAVFSACAFAVALGLDLWGTGSQAAPAAPAIVRPEPGPAPQILQTRAGAQEGQLGEGNQTVTSDSAVPQYDRSDLFLTQG